MSLEKRTREWVHKPVFHGAPVSWAEKYFRGRLKQFREEHKQFDEFLIEINKLVKVENNPDFANIEKFIDGEAEANWISPGHGLFDIFIKLFNLCLSPKQAFEYINECLALYKEMFNADYKLCGETQLSIKRDSLDDKDREFVSFSVKPTKDPLNRDQYYWFDITTSLKVIEDHINDITLQIDEFVFRCHYEQLEDALMLFEYYQNRGLFRKVFNVGIKELETRGIIKEVSQEDYYGWIIHTYETSLKMGNQRNRNYD